MLAGRKGSALSRSGGARCSWQSTPARWWSTFSSTRGRQWFTDPGRSHCTAPCIPTVLCQQRGSDEQHGARGGRRLDSPLPQGGRGPVTVCSVVCRSACWRRCSCTVSLTPRCRWGTCLRTAATTGASPLIAPTTSTTRCTPVLAWRRYREIETKDLNSLLLQVYSGLSAFLLCELGNLSIHLLLRNLRPAGTKQRRIPYPDSNPLSQLQVLSR